MGEYKSCSMCGNCKGGKVKVCQLGHKNQVVSMDCKLPRLAAAQEGQAEI